jgi:putative tryptophan/tyrosine transport system substrate-binding protein
VYAQTPARTRRVGVLLGGSENDLIVRAFIAALQQELDKLGWIEGRNIKLDFRWARADADRFPALARELMALQPDAIVAVTTTAAIALKRETTRIPVVFVNVVDPIGSGLVESLARPGGNFTGFIHFEPGMAGKWLEMLKQLAPPLTRVAILYSDKTLPSHGLYIHAVEAAAPSFAIVPSATPANDAAEIERAIDAFAHEPNGGLIVLPDATQVENRHLIITRAGRNRLPAVYPFAFFVRDGGLMSYGVDAIDRYRQAASYVDRILRGAKPADLPVQMPTKLELVINLKTAKALGLTIPQELLLRADEVIQ